MWVVGEGIGVGARTLRGCPHIPCGGGGRCGCMLSRYPLWLCLYLLIVVVVVAVDACCQGTLSGSVCIS